MYKTILLIVIISVISCETRKTDKTNKKDMIKSEVTTKGFVELETNIVWNKLIAFKGTEKFVPNLIEKVDLKGSGVGAVRDIYLKGGGKIIEKLTKIDIVNHRMEFIILSTPMPISEYLGIFEVHKLLNNKCEVLFISKYNVSSKNKDEMKAIIKEFQEIFISNLNK